MFRFVLQSRVQPRVKIYEPEEPQNGMCELLPLVAPGTAGEFTLSYFVALLLACM